jgi:hypothetical protein
MSKSYRYSAFGLRIRSNLKLPGLFALESGGGEDLRIWLSHVSSRWDSACFIDQAPWSVSADINELGQPTLRIWTFSRGAFLRVLYDDGTQFVLDRHGTRVWTSWPETITLEDAATYLFGPVLALVLRLRGITTLHASAVSVGKSAIAFVGDQGAGKSTTAAVLAQNGCPVITDDIVAIKGDNCLAVQPAHPYLCLWPSSAEFLYGARDSLPQLTPNWDKCYLDVIKSGQRFQREPLPLGSVYFLASRSESSRAPFIEDVSPQRGLIELSANSYGALRIDKQMREREFDLYARIASRVPLRRLTPHADPARLPALTELVLADARQNLCAA